MADTPDDGTPKEVIKLDDMRTKAKDEARRKLEAYQNSINAKDQKHTEEKENKVKSAFDPEHASIKNFFNDALDKQPFIVTDLFPVDVGMIYGPPGVAKSTWLIDALTRYSLGEPILGHAIEKFGKVLLISGEDNRARFIYRLKKLAKARQLTPEQIAKLEENIYYVDLSDDPIPMAERVDGNLMVTSFAKNLHERFKDHGPFGMVVIDPLASFNPEEASVNDGLQRVIFCARQITKYFQCFTCLVHHQSKAANLTGGINLDNARGGTALTAGVRFALQVEAFFTYQEEGKKTNLPPEIPEEVFNAGGMVLALHVTKNTDAPIPQRPYWVLREHGWLFTHTEVTSNYSLERQVIKNAANELKREKELLEFLCAFVRANAKSRYTARKLRSMKPELEAFSGRPWPGVSGIERLITKALDTGMLIRLPLPDNERGQKGDTYLYAPEEAM